MKPNENATLLFKRCKYVSPQKLTFYNLKYDPSKMTLMKK
jgi:hypothetical protein